MITGRMIPIIGLKSEEATADPIPDTIEIMFKIMVSHQAHILRFHSAKVTKNIIIPMTSITAPKIAKPTQMIPANTATAPIAINAIAAMKFRMQRIVTPKGLSTIFFSTFLRIVLIV